MTHMDHLDPSGIFLGGGDVGWFFGREGAGDGGCFALRKSNSHPHKRCRFPENPFDLVQYPLLPSLMEKIHPSSWAEASVEKADSSWVCEPRSANWRETVSKNSVLWWENFVNCSSGRCWLSLLCIGWGGCIQELCSSWALRTKSTYRQGNFDFLQKKTCHFRSWKTVGHVWVWLHHVTF